MTRDTRILEPESSRELVLTRLFDAPRARVFEAWTRREHIGQWWGPRGFTTTTHEMDVRPGGVWRYVMHGPDGTDYDNWIRYEEVVPPERLKYDHGEHDRDPNMFHVTVRFEERGEQTEITMRLVLATAAHRKRAVEEYGAIEGGQQTLDRLAEYLVLLGS